MDFQEILENVTVSEAEIMGKILFYLGDLEPAEKLKKWIVMRLGVDLYEASLCATSWVTTSRCPSGGYSPHSLHNLALILVIFSPFIFFRKN